MHLLSPRQFADAIGVSESSVRRWADDGRIRITKTAGGHRKIARTEAIRFVRETATEVVRPDLLEVPQPPHRRQRVEAFRDQHQELHGALHDGNLEVVAGLMETMYVNGVSAAQICDGPLRYAMQQIGELWPDDERGIFVEHRATSICIQALHQLRGGFRAADETAPLAIGGAPAKDPYLLPSMMVSTVLADAGLRTVNLGPNTPMNVLVQSARELNAEYLWISVTAQLPKLRFEAQIASALRRLRNCRTKVLIGGQSLRCFELPRSKRLHALASLEEMQNFVASPTPQLAVR